MNKLYFVESELYPRVHFNNESDRNEMALALWQEHIYFLGARTLNWYEDGIMTDLEASAASNIFTWEAPTWFDIPTQVAYFESPVYHSGIAYRDEIICACCGGVLSIEEIIEDSPAGVISIVIYDEWVDIRSEIIDENEDCFYYEENEV